MATSEQDKKERVVIYLPPVSAQKARVLAATMNISVSHLFEGLVEGAQIVTGENNKENYN